MIITIQREMKPPQVEICENCSKEISPISHLRFYCKYFCSVGCLKKWERNNLKDWYKNKLNGV